MGLWRNDMRAMPIASYAVAPHRILVADDDESSRMLRIDLLEGEGHEIFAASDGTVALATRFIPVVLVTGLANSTDRIMGIEAGADDFLSKPIRREELLARVRSLLRMESSVDELEEAETVLFSLALGMTATAWIPS
jgi:DNA-binding response OmpR family regulator